MRNVSHENEFDLHENYVMKCEDTHSTNVCTYAFSVPYLLDLFDTVNSLLSRGSLEPLISLDLVGTKLYSFSARVHCYHFLHIILSSNPVRRSKELRGGAKQYGGLSLVPVLMFTAARSHLL